MDHIRIIKTLETNRGVFESLFNDKNKEEYLWKPNPEKWCLLEIVCHLFDEEREDFKARVKHTLETPEKPMPMFDPILWVTERKYLEQDYNDMVQKFLSERISSVVWLNTLDQPLWKNAYNHPKLGPLSSEHFLANWLAHDYFHFRQINQLLFLYHQESSGNDLSYAGTW